jgi:ferredoxin
MYMISIDPGKCTLCDQCVAMCPNEIYKREGEAIIIGNTADCSNCQSCTSVCEPQAITITEI